MKSTAIAAGITLALGVSTAQAAFTALNDGTYQMEITGGCFAFGDCVTLAVGALADNTAGEASVTIATTTGALLAGTYGSGIAGDGIMGVIDFTLSGGSMTITSFSQDSYLNTPGGTFFLDAIAGVGGMGGSIDGSGNMTFDPTGRQGLAAGFATALGGQPWNLDNTSDGKGTGVFDMFTTGTDTNRSKGLTPGFTLTGAALQDAGADMWTGILVSAGNIGSGWGGFDNTQYSEFWNIAINCIECAGEPEPPEPPPEVIPVPAAVWLFGSGLIGLAGVARRKKSG